MTNDDDAAAWDYFLDYNNCYTTTKINIFWIEKQHKGIRITFSLLIYLGTFMYIPKFTISLLSSIKRILVLKEYLWLNLHY